MTVKIKSSYKSKQFGARKKQPRIIIISGLSGSGKTVALRAVEDAGFFCVDNLPISLINSLISKITRSTEMRNVAIGIDIREKEFFTEISKTIVHLRSKYEIEVLFLEAQTDVLIRRFRETRRPHPLGGNLENDIKSESLRLSFFRELSDRIIDTSSLSPHQLRDLMQSLVIPQKGSKLMAVNLISFGFKYGAPQHIDLLFDVRFLPNPFFVPSLKHLTGTNKRVSNYIFKHSEAAEFMEKVKNLLQFLIPLYIREGKSYLSIAFGCTGGNHRSPAIVAELYNLIKDQSVELNVIHRDKP